MSLDLGNIQIEGMDRIVKEIEKLDDKMKRKEIIKILRRQVEPMKEAIKAEAPVYDRTVARYTTDGKVADIYKAGNLRDSITIKSGRNKGYPNVAVGPAFGVKKKYDGYYSFFVVYGYAGNNRVAPNDFILRGATKVWKQVTEGTSDKLEKYIERKIKKLDI